MSYPHLFSPIRLGDTLVQNRIVANPMSEHYDDRCRGGAGVVICGHTIVEPGRSSWMSADEPYAFSKYERESTVARAAWRARVVRRQASSLRMRVSMRAPWTTPWDRTALCAPMASRCAP